MFYGNNLYKIYKFKMYENKLSMFAFEKFFTTDAVLSDMLSREHCPGNIILKIHIKDFCDSPQFKIAVSKAVLQQRIFEQYILLNVFRQLSEL